MACRYYDDILVEKLKRWIPDGSKLRVLKPDESKRLFTITADDNKDKPFQLPLIALSRSSDVDLLSTVKSQKSYDGLNITPYKKDSKGNPIYDKNVQKQYLNTDSSIKFNVLPIKLEYKLDIYTKTYIEGDEYLRNFLFKLINNPLIKVEIPYNDAHIEHNANIRVLTPVSDTSDIGERIFSGQFTRWTINLEIQDAFLFSIPYRKNWRLYFDSLEVSESIELPGEIEEIDPLREPLEKTDKED